MWNFFNKGIRWEHKIWLDLLNPSLPKTNININKLSSPMKLNHIHFPTNATLHKMELFEPATIWMGDMIKLT